MCRGLARLIEKIRYSLEQRIEFVTTNAIFILAPPVKYGCGLRDKGLNLLSSLPSTRNDAPKPDIRYHGLSLKENLITLFEVPFKNGSDEEVKRVRAPVTLAKGVFRDLARGRRRTLETS